MGSGDLSTVYVVIGSFLIVLGILWFFLPFAIFGTKDKLNELIAEAKTTNKQLADLKSEIEEFKKTSLS
jgi:F0F1-type ATP synthase membrane subunit b/b'